jgi:hypothetical protein
MTIFCKVGSVFALFLNATVSFKSKSALNIKFKFARLSEKQGSKKAILQDSFAPLKQPTRPPINPHHSRTIPVIPGRSRLKIHFCKIGWQIKPTLTANKKSRKIFARSYFFLLLFILSAPLVLLCLNPLTSAPPPPDPLYSRHAPRLLILIL